MKPFFKTMAGLGMVLAMACSACAPVPQTESAEAPRQTGTGELRLVTSDADFVDRSAGTQDGYYYVDRNANDANLRYIDYASAQDIFLSSRPEGNHFTTDDESYIPFVAGICTVFHADDTLYLLHMGSPGAADQRGQDALASVYAMGLDGSGRKLLYRGDANEELATTVAADGEFLYLISRKTQTREDGPGLQATLIRVDRATGAKDTLRELPDSAWMIGAFDRTLVFESIAASDNESGPPDMVSIILTCNLETQELSEAASWNQEQRMAVKVYEGKLVLAEAKSAVITVQELETGEVLKSFSLEGYAPSDGTDFWFDDCRDGKFVFWNWKQETLWGIDLETGEWTAVTLTYYNPDKMEARPVEIYAETDTEFLVCRSLEFLAREYGSPEGTAVEREAFYPGFALIAKDDYWNSVPNFRDVAWNG